MQFQRNVWLHRHRNKSFFSEKQMSIQFKRISHHSKKFVEFFVKEHQTLYQTCGKVNLFSVLEIYSAPECSEK